ncbi:DUF4352 domain-containing protein [Paenibacillus glucanolyticus]|jgi:hypothetical protein|uniref:DUF4352 domain-containing protein n=1 Tax=Paenibacillus TaxID=44249 RepID=UPI0003E27DAA|nr:MULTISPECIES: DUF4352 domain-containing protein [Paenibacillus]ANA79869.1 hypothetical protein A3958_07740 [Paenibacillus glucanolyticus]AVV56107.1 DUF4352 domain-containing protein [Paenibacillus glucanolyticus]ETT38250.1 hypothetical protein C169_11587 [Paenibacillus sp. FSL R5-808]MPY20164.1 DUF4352 domain-containing protein [Paenibacillus glucanolyticus]
MNKKVMLVAAVLLSMLLTAACSNDQADPPAETPPAVVGNEGADEKDPSAEESSTEPIQEDKESTANTDVKPIGEPAAVGDTVDYHGAVITLNSVRDSEGDEYLKPQAGHTFKVVELTVKNNGQEPLVISSALSFSLTDSSDLNYTVPITDDVKMLDGTVAPGGELKGEIPYEVKQGVQGLQLSYGDPMKEGRAIWTVE